MVIMNESLDPTIKNLASAIKRQESGGSKDPYNAKGASGEYGAYQFMPDTWKGWAKTHLGDANAPLTMENQNKVAYNQIKQWKDKGYNPAQIAAAWNAGEGSLKDDAWKNKVGVNQYGVKYDTPSYVKNVSQYYQEMKGRTPDVVQESQPVLTPQGIDISGIPTVTPPEQSVIAPIANSLTKAPMVLGGGVLNLASQAVGAEPQATYSNPLGEQQNALGYRDGQELGAYDTAKQGVGALAEGLSYGIGAGAVPGITQFGKAGLGAYIKPGIKAGAQAGALQGAGASLQEGDGLGVAALKGAGTAALGGVLGGTLGAGSYLYNNKYGFSPKIFNELDDAVRSGDNELEKKILTSPQYQQVLKANKYDGAAQDKFNKDLDNTIEEGIANSYGQSKLSRQEKANLITDDGVRAFSEHLVDSKNPIGDTKINIQNKADDLMNEALNPVINKVRDEKLALVPMDRKALIASFEKQLDNSYIPDLDKDGIKTYVTKLINRQNEGNPFGIVDTGIIRRDANFDFTNPKNQGAVSRILGNVMREALDAAESKAGSAEAKAIIAHINAVNKEYSRLMEGLNIVKLMGGMPGQKGSELLNKGAGFLGAGATNNNPLAYIAAHRATSNLQNMAIRAKNSSLYGNMSGKAGVINSSRLIGNAKKILNNVSDVSAKRSTAVSKLAATLEGQQAKTRAANKAEQQALQSKLAKESMDKARVDADIASRKTRQAKYIEENAYKPDTDLPVIDMGPKAKSKYSKVDPNLPSISYAAAPIGVAGLMDKIKNMGKETYQREPEPAKPDNTEELATQIANAETRGEKDPYKTSKWSDRKLGPASPLGKDLGKYQITSARLREKSEEFLGRKVTDKEFLNSPELQDKFIKAQIKWQKKNGLTDEEVLATHRRGWGNMKPEQLKKAVATSSDYIEQARAGK